MHANDFITARERIVKAYQRGIIDRQNAELALATLFAKIGQTEGMMPVIKEILG